MVATVTVGVLSSSIALLAAGRLAGRRGHLLQSAGWAAMAGFWGLQTLFVEVLGTGNYSNAVFTAMAVAFALYLSYHAFDAWALGVRSRPLDFMAGMAVISCIAYYPFEWSTDLAGAITYSVAAQTASVLSLMGRSAAVGGVHIGGGEVFVPIHGTGISIILACTAVQAFAIFGGAIAATHAPWRAKAWALFVSIVPIHLLNVLRNVAIIVLVTDHGLDFDFAHSVIGKLFSVAVLVVILYYVFTILPGLYDDIMGVLTLGDDIGPKARGGGGAGLPRDERGAVSARTAHVDGGHSRPDVAGGGSDRADPATGGAEDPT